MADKKVSNGHLAAHRGFTKTVDYILCDGLTSSWGTNCRVRSSYDFQSDHFLLVYTIKQPFKKADRLHHKPKKPEPDPIKQRNVKDLRNCPEYPIEIDRLLSNAEIPTQLDDKCEFLIDILKDATVKCLPVIDKEVKSLPWKDDPELLILQKLRDDMHRSNPEYKKLDKKFKKLLNNLKNQYHADEARAINSYAEARNIERAFRRMRAEALDDVPSNGCEPEKLRKHFKKHFTCDTTKPTPESLYDNPPEFLQSLLTISQHHKINNEPPSAPEIKQVLSKFKNGKAANDIPPELLKYARNSKTFLDELTKVLNEIWTTSTVPKTWGLARLTCLYKNKGSRKDPKMYRGLSVSSSLCKLAVCIILSRQNGWYEAQLSEPQHGFRQNRGTQDAILTFKSLQQISSRMKTKVYCAFVDLTAAFDTIQRPWLFKILRSRLGDSDNSNSNINVLEALYNSTSAHISDDEVSLAFELLAGHSGRIHGHTRTLAYGCLRKFQIESTHFFDFFMNNHAKHQTGSLSEGFKTFLGSKTLEKVLKSP